MNRFLLALVASAALADAPQAPSIDDGQVAQLKAASFKPAPLKELAGVTAAPIAIDPATKASVGYAKIPAGTTIPMHWHSHAEYSVLISGNATFTMDGKQYELEPGSYTVIPPRAKHELKCGAAAECVLLTRRAGPTDYNFVK